MLAPGGFGRRPADMSRRANLLERLLDAPQISHSIVDDLDDAGHAAGSSIRKGQGLETTSGLFRRSEEAREKFSGEPFGRRHLPRRARNPDPPIESRKRRPGFTVRLLLRPRPRRRRDDWRTRRQPGRGRSSLRHATAARQLHSGLPASDLVIGTRLGGRRNERINPLKRLNFKFAFRLVEAQLRTNGDVQFRVNFKVEFHIAFSVTDCEGICCSRMLSLRSNALDQGANPCARDETA